ncbi:MAG: WD40/YVTN/BNR-like repeat-containing protein [Myxococcota bacterium]
MGSARVFFFSLWSVLLVLSSACGAPVSEPSLSISPDRATFDGRSERVIFKIRAWEAGEKPGGGVVRLTAPVGQFIGGSELILIDGLVTATYACAPAEEPACDGTIRVTAEWADLHASTQVIGVELNAPAPVTWEVVPTGVAAELMAVEVAPNGEAWAVGERGTVLQLVGKTWRRLPSGVSATLRAITFDAAGAPLIVGEDGVLLRWRGDRFELVRLEGESFLSVARDAHDAIHVGARSGLIFELRDSDLVPELDMHVPVHSLTVQDGTLWAVGQNVVARLEELWLSVPPPMQGTIHFARAGTSGLWLGGIRQGVASVDGLLVQGPLPSWRTTVLSEPITAIAEVPRASERFALSVDRLYRQLGDASWTAVDCPSTARALASRGPDDLILVGPSGFSLLRRP